MKKIPRLTIIAIAAGIILALFDLIVTKNQEIAFYVQHLPGMRRFFRPTADGLIVKYGAPARSRLAARFTAKGLTYPPDKLAFIAIKSTKEMMVYVAQSSQPYKYVGTYPIFGASGHLGPKLREGDCQVPEGLYQLTLEPDTPYHAALRLNYPNATDLAHAQADGRTKPGSDILVHGTTGSIGCIAVGDLASEDLFVLAFDTQDKNILLIVAPVDLRNHAAPPPQPTDPKWLPELYGQIKTALSGFPMPK